MRLEVNTVCLDTISMNAAPVSISIGHLLGSCFGGEQALRQRSLAWNWEATSSEHF